MIPALIAAALFAAPPAAQPVAASTAPDPAIRLSLNSGRTFQPGDRAKVQVQTRDDGYIVVIQVDLDGHPRMLFPIDPGDDNFVRGGHRYEVKGRGGRESFTVEDGDGRGFVYAAYSPVPFHFSDYVRGDHWDYGTLPDQLPEQPEQSLNTLVERMTSDHFDYDILSYDVNRAVAYDGGGSSVYPYYDPWYSTFDNYCFGCYRPGLTVQIGFGVPYRRWWYDPAYYGPYVYDPFYDPYWGSYYYNSWYYPRYRDSWYNGWSNAHDYHSGYASYGPPRRGEPLSVWHFKDADRNIGDGVGYRPRTPAGFGRVIDARPSGASPVRDTHVRSPNSGGQPTYPGVRPGSSSGETGRRPDNQPKSKPAPRETRTRDRSPDPAPQPRGALSGRRRTDAPPAPSPSRPEAQPRSDTRSGGSTGARDVSPRSRPQASDQPRMPVFGRPQVEQSQPRRSEPQRVEPQPRRSEPQPSQPRMPVFSQPERRSEPSHSSPPPRAEPQRSAPPPRAEPQRSAPPPRAEPQRSAPQHAEGGRRRP